jgi:hypothetical protein
MQPRPSTSLLQCKECGGPISGSASKCPHCGANRLKAVGATPIQKVAGFLAMLIGIGVFLMSSFSAESNYLMTGLGAGFAIMGGLALFARSKR